MTQLKKTFGLANSYEVVHPNPDRKYAGQCRICGAHAFNNCEGVPICDAHLEEHKNKVYTDGLVAQKLSAQPAKPYQQKLEEIRERRTFLRVASNARREQFWRDVEEAGRKEKDLRSRVITSLRMRGEM